MNENKEISSLSYVNKDFGSIYPEMLDLAKQLTNKWDPSQSNESDPGVVLLKEGAFVADHNNYNIDKNILEAFLPSATQDRSVRNITEMNGYTPRYYVSANGYVTFVWDKDEEDESTDMFSVPAFTFVISDADETVSYTQIEDLSISKSGTPSSCRFIEGTLQTLSINDMSVINLENLDDNNRLYLPETMVAQNGIYVRNINRNDYDALWERNNYLLTQPLGSRVYKIDYDSIKMLPYLEFPTDIANIIGDGLEIKYIATSGTQGNVSANTLTKILSPSTFVDNSAEGVERSSENFSVFNAGAISNGKDPETIDEMYQSFRRVVGTFNTLVTCKDYDNEIYMLTDSNDNSLVSNVYVTDRRTDYNKSAQIMSWDLTNNFKRFKTISTSKCSLNFKGSDSLANIETKSADPGDMWYCLDNDELYVNMSTVSSRTNFVPQKSINLNDFAILTQAMTPYDLVMYAFKAFMISDYNADKYWLAYDNSFTPVTDAVREEIKSDIEKVKCISHTWNDPVTGDIYCFKNYAPLNILITPYNKVTEVEKNEIIDNVYKALSERFNLRNINFGEKLDIEEIEEVIVDSDSKIRRVDVLPIEYKTMAMYSDGREVNATGDILLELITKNVLAGRVCLFDFNEDFKYDYGQINGNVVSYDVEHQSTVKTELYIPLTTSQSDGATHESTGEKLTSTTQYETTGSNYMYEFILGAGPEASQTVYNGLSYTLQEGDQFILYDIDSAGRITKTKTWTKGTDIDISIVNRLDDGANLPTTAGKTALTATGDILIEKEINIKSIESDVVNLDYTLNKNEAIQIIYPNYYSDTTYSVYVNYRYEYSGDDVTRSIKANTDHTLMADEKIILVYSKEGSPFTAILNPGDVVNASFDLIPTKFSATVGVNKTWTDVAGISHTDIFKTLGTNQTISKRKLMTTKLNSTGIWCYWIVNSDSEGNNTLFDSATRERILRNNEYFIYTNSSLNELLILGAGTKLELTGSVSDFSQWSIPESSLTIESIANEGVSSSVPWRKNINFTETPVLITEMNVITLGETDKIKIVGWSSDLMPRKGTEKAFNITGYDHSTSQSIEDAFSICDGSITYTINGTSVTLPRVNNFYSIKSRLDLNTGPGIEQQLLVTKDESRTHIISAQRVYLNENGSYITVSAEDKDNCYIQSSEYCVGIGNIINLNENTKFYAYSKDGLNYPRGIKLPTATSDDQVTQTRQYTFYCNSLADKEAYMVPIHITGSQKLIKAKFSGSRTSGNTTTSISLSIRDYNSRNQNGDLVPAVSELTLQGDTSYYLVPVAAQGVDTTDCEIKLTLSWTGKVTSGNEVITVEDLVVIDGMNPELSNVEGCDMQSVLKKMAALIAGSDTPSTKPYYPYKLDNSIAMDITDFEDSYAMWDKNNIANKMTVAQIDLKKSIIEIVKDMRNGDY